FRARRYDGDDEQEDECREGSHRRALYDGGQAATQPRCCCVHAAKPGFAASTAVSRQVKASDCAVVMHCSRPDPPAAWHAAMAATSCVRHAARAASSVACVGALQACRVAAQSWMHAPSRFTQARDVATKVVLHSA